MFPTETQTETDCFVDARNGTMDVAAAECAKLVTFYPRGSTCLSGDTPGDREWFVFPSRERRCVARIIAHASPDSLAHSRRRFTANMHSRDFIASCLASAFAAGTLEVEVLVDRGQQVLGRKWRWLHPLAKRITEAFVNQVRPRQRTIKNFILCDRGFSRAYEKHSLRVENPLAIPSMNAGDALRWNVGCTINTTGELAEWLDLSIGELEWFSDLRRMVCNADQLKLRHYHYRVLTKRHGQFRLIEAPKNRLKAIQQKILAEILNSIPPHEAAHGFCRDRSIKTFAEPHVAKDVVVKLDLHDFFPSIRVGQVNSLFRTLGFPEAVADHLAGLCTTSAPGDILNDTARGTVDLRNRSQLLLYSQPHLPQGAPTSPAIANLCAYRMDCRLAGLAKAAGAIYTRYADDLVFSGDATFRRSSSRFLVHAAAIIMDQGFQVHHRKTRVMKQGVQQRVVGVVVNQHLNVPRPDFDRMKAILNNCITLGPESQNRQKHADFKSHLEGKISYFEMINPRRGERLRSMLNKINWESE